MKTYTLYLDKKFNIVSKNKAVLIKKIPGDGSPVYFINPKKIGKK